MDIITDVLYVTLTTYSSQCSAYLGIYNCVQQILIHPNTHSQNSYYKKHQ